jgi:hypothetical protein
MFSSREIFEIALDLLQTPDTDVQSTTLLQDLLGLSTFVVLFDMSNINADSIV